VKWIRVNKNVNSQINLIYVVHSTLNLTARFVLSALCNIYVYILHSSCTLYNAAFTHAGLTTR